MKNIQKSKNEEMNKKWEKWKTKSKKKDEKNGRKKVGTEGKEGPKGLPPEMGKNWFKHRSRDGPKIWFFT